MSAIDQKEYLKRYLSLGDEKEKNKKRKKRAKAIQNRVKIIDDDIDLPRNVNEDEMREFLTAEDAPQIVGIVDDRPLHMRIDDYRKSDKWKLVGSDDELKDDSKTKASYSKQSDSDASPPRKTKKNRNDDRSPLRFDFKKETKGRRHSDSDPSPPRKNRRRSSSDPSPPRRNRRKSKSPPRTSRKISPDISPPRKNKKNFDESPPRKTKKQSDSDASPPRKSRTQSVSDSSPPRKSRKQSDSDASPPRKSRKQSVSDSSPPRKSRKQSDSEASPPRKSRKQIDSNPPRKSRKEVDSSPPRKSRKEMDISPPRKSRRVSPDLSPPRKTIKNSNSEPKVRKSRWGSASKSPPRKSKKDLDSKRSHSHEINKMTKTLDGKTAGIQFAGDLKKENAALKKHEDEMFKNMSAEISGKNAAPIMRDRKTGKRRDLEKEAMEEMEKQKVLNERKEKYDKWGKGLKQVEDHKQKIEQDLYEMTKPLARYADDEDLEKYLKEQEREGDPMLQYIRKKKRKEAVASGRPINEKPQYEGEFMPNRYGIPPGHRWDGVDRSNGYEKQWFKVQNDKKAVQEEVYKWSTEDM